MSHRYSSIPRAEALALHDLIDPRDTRPMLCRWVERAYKALPNIVAKKNRIFGWIPTYRKNLRKKHKEDILKAPLIYVFLTYIRSLIRFLISKTNLIL